MNKLSYMKLKDDIKEIENESFFQNNFLEEVDLNNVHTIGYSVFQECRFLKRVTLSPATKMIRSNAFKKCDRLKSIKIPAAKNLVIEACAFLNCPLKTVDFGKRTDFSKIHDNTLLIAGDRCPVCKSEIKKTRNGIHCSSCEKNYDWNAIEAFEKLHVEAPGILKEYAGYNGLLQIPKGITAIAPQAFDDSAVSFVSIPDTVSQIGVRAFHWSDRLSELELKTSQLKRLEHQTFTGTLLSSFSCPNNLEYIGRSAFSGCKLLSNVYFSDSEKMIGEMAFYECQSLDELEIGSSVNVVGAYAYANNSSLQKVMIPESVLILQSHCFLNCYNLSHLRFCEGLLNIEDHAFYGCEKLEEIFLPDSLLSIGENAFKCCTQLKKASLPASLREMNLTKIFEPETTIVYRTKKYPWQ